jgi:hypothetical protein
MVLRIVSALALLAVVAAGCGGADRPQRSAARGVPPALAQRWEDQASAIAHAASAGNSCRALQLATSLRKDVVESRRKLPSRLQSPLLTGVHRLADRITCTPPPSTPVSPAPQPAPKPGPKPPKHDHHGHDEHGHHHDHGHGHGGNG